MFYRCYNALIDELPDSLCGRFVRAAQGERISGTLSCLVLRLQEVEMHQGVFSALARILLAAFIFALPILGNAQSTTNKIPTAAQVAMQKNTIPASHMRKMGRTTSSQRWAAAIRNADRRAAKLRKHGKGVR